MWSDLIWSDLVWSDLVLYSLVWSYLIWSYLIWSDVWSDLIWSDLVWSDLLWSDVRSDLVLSGLILPGLFWYCLIRYVIILPTWIRLIFFPVPFSSRVIFHRVIILFIGICFGDHPVYKQLIYFWRPELCWSWGLSSRWMCDTHRALDPWPLKTKAPSSFETS
jgi:hypothetical protein